MMARFPQKRWALFSCLLPTLALTSAAHADDFRIEKAEWKAEDQRLLVVGKGRNGSTVTVANAGPSGNEVGSTSVRDDDWQISESQLESKEVPCRIAATQSDGATAMRDVAKRPADCDDGTSDGDNGGGGNGAVSINSTSQNSTYPLTTTVTERPIVPNTDYSVLAINDLGMHCGDLDTRIAGILPPFQALLAQIIQKGGEPTINPAGLTLWYSAASNPNDPILDRTVFDGLMVDGSSYKTNFWGYAIAPGAYDAFYPPLVTPLSNEPFPVTADQGLPVPNVEELYIGADGVVDQNCDEPDAVCDGTLTAVQHAMPGLSDPYVANAPQQVHEHYNDKPFFVNFPFGYVAENVNWLEGAGIPFTAFDDFGRENAYPLVRVEARDASNNVVATVDTVLPISGEASCTNCHATQDDYISVHGGDENNTAHRTDGPIDALNSASLPVATSVDDMDMNMPPRVSLEYAADLNILRLHDLKHGDQYVTPTGEGVATGAPCDIHANNGDGDANCLTHKALVQGKPVVCQVCHYTPALDLAHVGPMTGPPGTTANGRNQLAHQSNSRVMHHHHGQFGDLFTPIPAPVQDANGIITNQDDRLAALENNCYQCHPGKNTQCLRGVMYNAGMLCSDCHGSMAQVGADFTGPVAGDASSQPVSPTNPGDFKLTGLGDFYDPDDPQPRVPWANEPGCGSCHTGDALNNALTNGDVNAGEVIVNIKDVFGNTDGIRLRQAFRTSDLKATPIVPSNKRFAEDPVPAQFNGFVNPGAGNPKLYRVSTGGVELAGGGESGHGGVFCEGCHGATHAEWPNANPLANDNVTANQLQGHTGVIIECSTCHTGDLGNTLEGPHGMHPVGDVRFVNGGHEHMAENDLQACARCHGAAGQGTVLSVAKATRTGLDEVGTIAKGTAVNCGMCHSNPFTESENRSEE